uniref:OSJNBb0062H02.13 protein n=1 Tax=Oryza sativa subsp. japonica TaxID=39947 RepID=Q7XW35_ORYSJ|nr:OSJNBb0062H02.13 [Oryza sativa Japonica Group]
MVNNKVDPLIKIYNFYFGYFFIRQGPIIDESSVTGLNVISISVMEPVTDETLAPLLSSIAEPATVATSPRSLPPSLLRPPFGPPPPPHRRPPPSPATSFLIVVAYSSLTPDAASTEHTAASTDPGDALHRARHRRPSPTPPSLSLRPPPPRQPPPPNLRRPTPPPPSLRRPTPDADPQKKVDDVSARTGNKIPKERFRITAVDAVGLPTSPRKILSRFRSIGRQKFSILQDDIKHVSAAEKDIAWLTFKESFDYPAEHADHLRRAAFKVMGNAWKNFKTKLVSEFVYNPANPDPREKFPWIPEQKYGLPDYAWQYKKRSSNKAEKDARLEAKIRASIRAELTSEFDKKLESMRAKIRQEIREEQQNTQAAAAAAHEELGSPTQKRSSCASTDVAENPTSVDSAVDHITEPTSCTLTVRVMPTYTVPAAEGLAYKPTLETRVHGAQLRGDCAKVQVDSVKPEYELFLPKYPLNDEVLSLGNAHAPRKLDLGKGQEETKGKEIKKKYVAPQEFQLGMPLVGDDVLAAMGTACKDLHAYYMEKSNARKPNKATDILGEHDGKPFLGPTDYIVVDFKDLFDLYRLRAVDTSLLKCYSLLSWQWCQKNAPEVAFLDPQVVTVTNLQNDRQGMVNYIYDTLWSRRDKEYIMCAYNQYAHWILLVITPKWSTCYYLNSRIDKNAYDWTLIQLAIDEAWAQYVQRGGLRKTGHDTLIHKKDFPVKQQIGDQCGFHVCHNMRLLYREKVKTLAEFEVRKYNTVTFEQS